jgi:hypothetical protein
MYQLLKLLGAFLMVAGLIWGIIVFQMFPELVLSPWWRWLGLTTIPVGFFVLFRYAGMHADQQWAMGVWVEATGVITHYDPEHGALTLQLNSTPHGSFKTQIIPYDYEHEEHLVAGNSVKALVRSNDKQIVQLVEVTTKSDFV